MLIQENLEDVDPKYIKEIYSNSVLQYLIFRYNIKNEFENDKTLASGETASPISPRVVKELDPISKSEFDHAPAAEKRKYCKGPVDNVKLCKRDIRMLSAASVALTADSLINKYELSGKMPTRKKTTVADKLAKNAKKNLESVKKTAQNAGNGIKNIAAKSTHDIGCGVKKTWELTRSGAHKFYRAHAKEIDAAGDMAADIAVKAALACAVLVGHQMKNRK